jgi:Mor family transcriptional regulator
MKISDQCDFKSKAAELLLDLAAQCALVLRDITGIDAEKAELVGQEIAVSMAKHWGGQNLYFPKGLSFQVSQRYLEIYNEFNGRNHAELAMKYDLTVQWVYRIIKLFRQMERDLAQRSLFDGDDGQVS